MCFGGGDKASKAAERQERERQARISSNVSSIEGAYAGREGPYNDFVQALRERFGTEFGRQRADAARKSKFALARGGLTGGSAAIDATRLLRREGDEGTLQAERKAQGALANLRSADESSKLQLISLAQSGSDIGNAALNAGNSIRANLEGARSTAASEGIGDVFGRTATAYRAQQDAAQRRRGLREAEVYASPFGGRGP